MTAINIDKSVRPATNCNNDTDIPNPKETGWHKRLKTLSKISLKTEYVFIISPLRYKHYNAEKYQQTEW